MTAILEALAGHLLDLVLPTTTVVIDLVIDHRPRDRGDDTVVAG